jgi:ribosomal-protein-alanine N-acetyltransferase
VTAAKINHDPWPPPPELKVDGVVLVEMEPGHVDRIVEIENESFPIPWEPEAFEHDIEGNELAHYWILEKDGEIIGYAGIWLIDTLAHLTTICIEQNHRGLGLGRWLLLEVMRLGADLGAKRFTLEVRESNDNAIKLYESVGYRVAGRREKYYKEINEDALVMWTGSEPYRD